MAFVPRRAEGAHLRSTEVGHEWTGLDRVCYRRISCSSIFWDRGDFLSECRTTLQLRSRLEGTCRRLTAEVVDRAPFSSRAGVNQVGFLRNRDDHRNVPALEFVAYNIDISADNVVRHWFSLYKGS